MTPVTDRQQNGGQSGREAGRLLGRHRNRHAGGQLVIAPQWGVDEPREMGDKEHESHRRKRLRGDRGSSSMAFISAQGLPLRFDRPAVEGIQAPGDLDHPRADLAGRKRTDKCQSPRDSDFEFSDFVLRLGGLA